MSQVVYVTSNQAKFEEAKEHLPSLTQRSVDITEVQGGTEEVVRDKAFKAYNAVSQPCVVDDASLRIADLGGFPGPYVKDFLNRLSLEEIGSSYAGSAAGAVVNIAYADGENVHVFSGSVSGRIVMPRGDGWGYEPVFQPSGHEKTWAELGDTAVKHREKALLELKSFLAG